MTNEIFQKLKEKAHNLPESPGVYQFLDKDGKIIYIGKAKNLKKRVTSYFTKTHEDPKTRILVRNIRDIHFIVVETELDALLLENTLIKKYKPKYNIQLKDDKSYPWIVIKNEHFPRVFYTRNIEKDGSEYYGPYTSVHLVRTMISMFKEIFKIRTCNLDLSPEKIKAGKYRPCLEYHIKNCYAPCIGLQSEQDYMKNIEQIRKILKGKISSVIDYMKKQMMEYAEKWEFEKAQEIKESLQLLENYQSRSTVVNPNLGDLEVYTILEDDNSAYVNFMKVADGKIIQTFSSEVKKKLNETKEEILEHTIIQIRNSHINPNPVNEILVPFPIELKLPNVKITVPKIGDKKKLIDLSLKNLEYYRQEKLKSRENIDPTYRATKLLEQVKNDLNLKNIPIHIECFDNSNLYGTNAVAACVVFKYGKPSKKDYRKFNIKTVDGIDDFAMMREVVYRRYKRLLDEGKDLPDLIVIDGGKGQLSAALESLKKLGIHNKVDIIAIAKRLDEIFKPDDPYPIYLDKKSYTLRLIQQVRDEAHRFGITFHRQKRDKNFIQPELTQIKGIGIKTYEKLIHHFGSPEKIKNATFEQLKQVIGQAKAKLVYKFYHSKNQTQ